MSLLPTLPQGLQRQSPRSWTPHPYQERAVEFLTRTASGALFLEPGLGKTSIVLEAFRQLKAAGRASKALVVAPLRVCQTVWRQEAAKWEQFNALSFEFLHGDKKAESLATVACGADVYLINPEGVPWLADECTRAGIFPFDTVVIDELTRFKNARAQRHKALRPLLRGTRRRWGLTGTPAPNGYLDLFGQFLILDDGAALGKYITHYRMAFFTQARNGFDWDLQPGAQERIEERIRPYVLRMAAEDYLDLPPLVDDVRVVELDKHALSVYRQMKHDMLALLPDGAVTAQNAGGVANKLRQIANGAVYESAQGKEGEYQVLHAAKLDAVAELVEDLAGQPLLLAYEYQHDLERLRMRFPNVPYLGSGVGEKRTSEVVRAWNAGSIPLLLAHPKSAGHGLNLQGSNCGHVAWLSPTYDLELYEQFIDRVKRQGNTSSRIVNHIFVAQGTIDEQVLQIIRTKRTTQDGLLRRLADAITQEDDMERLGTLNGQLPKGWGPPPSEASDNGSAKVEPVKTAEALTPQQEAERALLTEAVAKRAGKTQREAIRDKIDGSKPREDRAAIAKQLLGGVATATGPESAPVDAEWHELPAAQQAPSAVPEIDYDKLAGALLRKIAGALSAA